MTEVISLSLCLTSVCSHHPQVYWTREVTEVILASGCKGLQEYAKKCTEQLNKIVGLVRGQLTSLERSTCGALVVIDVHARYVVCLCLVF